MLVWACVVLRGRNLTDRPRGLFFNQEGQTASKSCITSVTSEQQAIKGFTDSYETDLPAEGFVTHGFCSFLPFGTLGGATGSAGSTLDWGNSPVPLNCNKLVFFICGWFRVAVQIRLSHPEWKHISGENTRLVYSFLPSSPQGFQYWTLHVAEERPHLIQTSIPCQLTTANLCLHW